MEAADIRHYIKSPDAAPIFQVLGENDLEYVRELTQELADHCGNIGVQHSLAQVPSAGHFYPRHATVVTGDGETSTVDQTLIDFLEKSLGSSAPAIARLS